MAEGLSVAGIVWSYGRIKRPLSHTGGLLACSVTSDKRRKRRAVRFSAKTFWCRAQLGPVRAGAQRQCDTVARNAVSASLVGHLL